MKPTQHSNSARTLITLLPYLWPRDRQDLRLRVLIAVICLVAAKAANVFVPLLLGDAVDQLDNLADTRGLWLGIPLAVILAYGLFRLTTLVLNQVRDALFARVAQNAVRTLARQIFDHLH